MTRRLRAAVIGCGVIANEHLGYLAAADDIDLVAVCDLSPVAASYNAERFGAGGWYTDHRQLLQECHPDVVHILTPPSTHPALARESMDAGAHVVCEKPLAPTAGEVSALMAHAAERGKLLIESQNMRFNDPVLAIERLCREGTLGEVMHVDVEAAIDVVGGGKFSDPNVPSPARLLPGGAVHDFLPHMSYMALHFFGYPATARIASLWRNKSGIADVVFDEMSGIVEFDGGGTASLRFSSYEKPDRFRIAVDGTLGRAEVDVWEPYLRSEHQRVSKQLSPVAGLAAAGAGFMRASVVNLRNKVLQHSAYHGMPRMLAQFYDAVRGDGPVPILPSEMTSSATLIDSLIEGARP